MRWKISRLSLIASMITPSPGATSTMEAAARAASVAPETAKPQSAFFSAGASLTPSPVMPTMWSCFCMTSTMWNLCSGKTWAKPSASSISLATSGVSSVLESPSCAAVENVRAHPQGLGHLARDRQRVARHHLDLDAHLGGGRDGRPLHPRAEDRRAATPRAIAISRRRPPARRPARENRARRSR